MTYHRVFAMVLRAPVKGVGRIAIVGMDEKRFRARVAIWR